MTFEDIEELLRAEASKTSKRGPENTHFVYRENVSPDAINGDAWLDNHSPYIWKVGALLLIDNNKADWFEVYIGYQRGNESYETPTFIGRLSFPQGENDDAGRTIDRAFTLLEFMHPAFGNQ